MFKFLMIAMLASAAFAQEKVAHPEDTNPEKYAYFAPGSIEDLKEQRDASLKHIASQAAIIKWQDEEIERSKTTIAQLKSKIQALAQFWQLEIEGLKLDAQASQHQATRPIVDKPTVVAKPN